MEALRQLLQRLPALQAALQKETQEQAGGGAEGQADEPPEGPEPVGCCAEAAAGTPEASLATRQASPKNPALPGALAEAAATPAVEAAAPAPGAAPVAAEPALPQDVQQAKAQKEAEPPQQPDVEPLPLTGQLELLLLHLRQAHCYCYFCGTAYDGPDDMEAHCPGLTEDEH
eukprot:XP_001699980.1 predicted protein [Chlamydomonas reinhardtii]